MAERLEIDGSGSRILVGRRKGVVFELALVDFWGVVYRTLSESLLCFRLHNCSVQEDAHNPQKIQITHLDRVVK